MSEEIDGDFHPSVIRKVRHCKTCKGKCHMKKPIIGCESIMVPGPPLKLFGEIITHGCERRIWFDKNYFPIEFWRTPTEAEIKTLSRKERDKKLREELKKLQEEARAHGRRAS